MTTELKSTKIATFSIPSDAFNIYSTQQDDYSISDLKIILIDSLDQNRTQKVVYAHSALLMAHSEYLAHLLSGDYSDVGLDSDSATEESPRKLVQIEEECPTDLMEMLLRSLCSRCLMKDGSKFRIEIHRDNIDAITFEGLHQLIQFMNVTDKWQVQHFDFTQLRHWIMEDLLFPYNVWWFSRYGGYQTYRDAETPQHTYFEPFWVCELKSVNRHGKRQSCTTINAYRAARCKNCGRARSSCTASPARYVWRAIPNLRPRVPLQMHMLTAWRAAFGYHDEVHFFFLTHASMLYPAVSRECIAQLKASPEYELRITDVALIAQVFRVSLFDMEEGCSLLEKESFQRFLKDYGFMPHVCDSSSSSIHIA